MVNIPSIHALQQTYSRFRRRGNIKVLNTEHISDDEDQKPLPGRRRKGDRRKRSLKVIFDRRTIHSRRNKQFAHRSTTIRNTKKAPRKGMNINTTA